MRPITPCSVTSIIENLDPDDTTLLRNPQRVMDLVDDLLKDNARLRRQQKRDNRIHLAMGGGMLAVIVALVGVIIVMALSDQ